MFSHPLTTRQRQILDFIVRQRGETGIMPTLREIQAHFRFASVNAVASHLRALENKGFVKRASGRARSIRLPFGAETNGLHEIPVYGAIPAGFASLAEEQREEGIRVDLDSLKIRRTAQTFALLVRGDSMVGAHILNGDIVILEVREPKPGDIVAALIDGETTLKRLVVEEGRSFLRAENPRYPDLVPLEELTAQGVVRAVIRRMERGAAPEPR